MNQLQYFSALLAPLGLGDGSLAADTFGDDAAGGRDTGQPTLGRSVGAEVRRHPLHRSDGVDDRNRRSVGFDEHPRGNLLLLLDRLLGLLGRENLLENLERNDGFLRDLCGRRNGVVHLDHRVEPHLRDRRLVDDLVGCEHVLGGRLRAHPIEHVELSALPTLPLGLVRLRILTEDHPEVDRFENGLDERGGEAIHLLPIAQTLGVVAEVDDVIVDFDDRPTILAPAFLVDHDAELGLTEGGLRLSLALRLLKSCDLVVEGVRNLHAVLHAQSEESPRVPERARELDEEIPSLLPAVPIGAGVDLGADFDDRGHEALLEGRGGLPELPLEVVLDGVAHGRLGSEGPVPDRLVDDAGLVRETREETLGVGQHGVDVGEVGARVLLSEELARLLHVVEFALHLLTGREVLLGLETHVQILLVEILRWKILR